MTWSPFFTDVTPGPMSTTMPAPSWPRIAGKSPSGSAPERVNSSVWQMPVALISTSTSPALGPSRSTVSMARGSPAFHATAARVFIGTPDDQGVPILFPAHPHVEPLARLFAKSQPRIQRPRRVALLHVQRDRDPVARRLLLQALEDG